MLNALYVTCIGNFCQLNTVFPSLQLLCKFLLALSQELTCPITSELFLRPVVTSSGNTYELSALLKTGYDPISRRILDGDLPPNRLAELIIERFGHDLEKLPDDI